jgi:hypothetical protein
VTNAGEDPGASGAEEKMDGVKESEVNTLAKSSMWISSYREEEKRLGLKGTSNMPRTQVIATCTGSERRWLPYQMVQRVWAASVA